VLQQFGIVCYLSRNSFISLYATDDCADFNFGPSRWRPETLIINNYLHPRAVAAHCSMSLSLALTHTHERSLPLSLAISAGDFIVWDSRTVHCNTPALSSTSSLSLSNSPHTSAPVNLPSTPSDTASSPTLARDTNSKTTLAVPETLSVAREAGAPAVGSSDVKLMTAEIEGGSGQRLAAGGVGGVEFGDKAGVDIIRLCAYVSMLPATVSAGLAFIK
jgi:hypothetical protein